MYALLPICGFIITHKVWMDLTTCWPMAMRDLLLSVTDSAVKQVISEAVEHIFIAHVMTWFIGSHLKTWGFVCCQSPTH